MAGTRRSGGSRGHLAVLDEFKTRRGAPTGTALRQRAILGALAAGGEPAERTRTGIAQRVTDGGSARWKNVYSGVFQDIDGALVPLGLVEEAGRIPPRRGPRALRESGIPYYHLTRAGALVALAFGDDEGLEGRVAAFFAESSGEEARVGRALAILAGFAPRLARTILAGHVKEFCEGRQRRLVPVTTEKLDASTGAETRATAEFLSGALELDDDARTRVIALLRAISGGEPTAQA